MTSTEEPKIAPKSAAEKEASAYWFRQISTALALGNAGGIATLAGFAGNIENIKIAAVITYPSVSYFMTGAFLSFAPFLLQFLYSTFRLEAHAEIDEKRIEWQSSRGENPKLNPLPTITFFIYFAIIMLSLISSGFYFLKGAREISSKAAALYCASANETAKCQVAPTFILSPPSKRDVELIRGLTATPPSSPPEEKRHEVKPSGTLKENPPPNIPADKTENDRKGPSEAKPDKVIMRQPSK